MNALHRTATQADLIRTALTRFGDRVAFVHEGRSFTYAQSADLLGRIVRVLGEHGIGRGDGLAVLSTNRPEAWFTASAVAMLGGRYSALHPLGSRDDFTYVCGDAGIRTFVFDAAAFDEKAAALADAVDFKNVFSIGPSSFAPDLLHLAAAGPSGSLPTGVDPSDAASILYTGGTTGRPKGVVLPHRVWTNTILTILADFQLPDCPRYLAASPITHASGMMLVPTLLRGGTIHLHPSFDPERYLRTIASERINLCFGVPTMIYVLLDHPLLGSVDLSSLETFLYAAAPMSPARLKEGLERIGPVFTQYYGQTESGGTGTVLAREEHADRLASCGKPMSTMRLSLHDDEGNEVATGEPGEICIRGPSVMDGYWKQPELNEEALRGGWLHTGDMATRDEEGFFTIVDRKKDMIVSGGFNVFPREIEDVLTSHPSVAACAVIGVPDDKWGEAVKAVVVCRTGSSVDADELIALVKDRKGPVYAPKSVDFVDEIPLTAVAKADKKALRARYWQGADRLVH